MEKLREEILQAEQTRSDLLKLKLSLVGAIGALGLGFSAGVLVKNAVLVLNVIPFVCVYVDLLCRHLTLRIVVIGSFLRSPVARKASEAELMERYEEWAQYARELSRPPKKNKEQSDQRSKPQEEGEAERKMSAFDLEDWALEYSTYILSAGILVYGLYLAAMGSELAVLFLLSGPTGLVATWIGNRKFKLRYDALTYDAPESDTLPPATTTYS